MNDSATPVRYVLYSHYGYNEDNDFRAYKAGAAPEDLEGTRFLISHFRGLKELLTVPAHEGLLVLFYAPGYDVFLDGLARGDDDEHLLADLDGDDDHLRLRFAKEVADYVTRRLTTEQLADRVRFITSFDLRPILGRVNAISAAKFRQYFLGPAKGIRYDSPKVLEAILRLRVLGNGVPVLRLDHDVIFRGSNSTIGDLGLFKAVACALRAYHLRLAETSVSTFLFSASYNSRALLYPSEEIDRFEAWSRAFATRVYPALIADPHRILALCNLPENTADEKGQKSDKWNEYVKACLDESLVRQFYGLKNLNPNQAVLESDGTAGLTSIGAHPLHSVISGAMLCLSEGAILDLPPFSNFGINVMWIDDHLKYSLHRAMKHFTSGEILNLGPGLSEARMDDVTVTKARPAVNTLHKYIFDVYLPTLLWGAVMDAWVNVDPILKCRVDSLNEDGKVRWRQARDNQHDAPLPKAMLEALRKGVFDDSSDEALRKELERSAIKRIEEVRQLWALLKTESQNTFASYWAEGKVKDAFGSDIFKGCKDRLWQGIAPERDLNQPIESLDDLSVVVALTIMNLIGYTANYVHWTLEWPRFVQIVRSIPQGSFIGDLSWTPKHNPLS
jgi:hypothetical protein